MLRGSVCAHTVGAVLAAGVAFARGCCGRRRVLPCAADLPAAGVRPRFGRVRGLVAAKDALKGVTATSREL